MNASLRANLQEEVRDRLGEVVAAAFANAIANFEIPKKAVHRQHDLWS